MPRAARYMQPCAHTRGHTSNIVAVISLSPALLNKTLCIIDNFPLGSYEHDLQNCVCWSSTVVINLNVNKTTLVECLLFSGTKRVSPNISKAYLPPSAMMDFPGSCST